MHDPSAKTVREIGVEGTETKNILGTVLIGRQRYVFCGKQKYKIGIPRLCLSALLHLLFAKTARSTTVLDRQEPRARVAP